MDLWFFNDLISSNQSLFKQENSCINQLLSITHDIYQSLNQGYEVRGVFLDISKTFDKVWHKGLIHKLEQNGIGGPLLKILADFVKSRKQSCSKWSTFVSDWCSCRCSTTVLGPSFDQSLVLLLFLIFVDDLSDGLQYNRDRWYNIW